MKLENKVIAITGAGSGIGKSIALESAINGAQVALIDLNQDNLKSALKDITDMGGVARPYACDVSNANSVKDCFNQIYSNMGKVDVLVNNAGVAHVGSIENTKEEDLDRLYAINVKGVYHCVLSVLEEMKKQASGSILNLASIASKVGIEDRFAYSMSKGAVYSMTLSIARDYIKHGIRCNCICPARVHTPFVDNFIKNNYPEREEEIFSRLSEYQPIGRMGKPEEIAKLAVFLSSDDASFITGSAYDIDGGVTLLR